MVYTEGSEQRQWFVQIEVNCEKYKVRDGKYGEIEHNNVRNNVTMSELEYVFKQKVNQERTIETHRQVCQKKFRNK